MAIDNHTISKFIIFGVSWRPCCCDLCCPLFLAAFGFGGHKLEKYYFLSFATSKFGPFISGAVLHFFYELLWIKFHGWILFSFLHGHNFNSLGENTWKIFNSESQILPMNTMRFKKSSFFKVLFIQWIPVTTEYLPPTPVPHTQILQPHCLRKSP